MLAGPLKYDLILWFHITPPGTTVRSPRYTFAQAQGKGMGKRGGDKGREKEEGRKKKQELKVGADSTERSKDKRREAIAW